MTLGRKIAFGLWLFLIIAGILFFALHPELLNGTNMKAFIARNANEMKSFYVFICCARCLTLIPATPFIVAGVLLFPEDLHFVMIVTTGTVLIAATIHFYFSRLLEFDKVLERRFSDRMEKLKSGMKKRGFLIIYLWTIAPFLPSDLAYYLAGISGMNYWRFITAVALGGCVIIGVYVYMGKDFFEWLLEPVI